MFVGGFGGAACTFLLLVVLARTTGPTDTGLFFQAISVVSICSVASAWGTGATLQPRTARHLAHGHQDLGPVLGASLLPVVTVSILVALVLAVFHGQLASVMTTTSHEEALGHLLVATAPAVPALAITRLFAALARGVGTMGPSALYDMGGQPLVRLLACGGVAMAGRPLWFVGATFASVSLACLLAIIPHVHRSLSAIGITLHDFWRWPRAEARAFWAYSGPRGLEELFQATNTWLLVVLVGSLASPGEAATYAAISRFTLASGMLTLSISSGMATRFTQAIARGDGGRTHELFRAAVVWSVGLVLPLAATMFLFPAALIHLVSPGLPDGTTGLRLLAVATVITTVTGPSGAVILFAGKSAWNLWISIPALALMLAVAWATVPDHGADGAALAWASAIVVQSAIGYVVTRTAFGLDPLQSAVARMTGWSVALAVPALTVTSLALGDNIRGMLVGVAVGAALTLGANHLTSWQLWRRHTTSPPTTNR